MLKKVATWAFLASVCAVSGYLIAENVPQLHMYWWSGWVGAAAGLALAFLTLGLENIIKRNALCEEVMDEKRLFAVKEEMSACSEALRALSA